MKRAEAVAANDRTPGLDRTSLTSEARLSRWTDHEVEAMASTDPDHPPLDDAFWNRVDARREVGGSESKGSSLEYVSERSYQAITTSDLLRLANLTLGKLDELATRIAMQPAGLNRPHLRLIVLAQGAALHLVDHHNGIKDFDIWAFFESGTHAPFPHRSIWNADFGPSKFGIHPDDLSAGFLGRRIDIIGRSIPFDDQGSERSAVLSWLKAQSDSARHLSRRPLIAVYPEHLLGKMIWTPAVEEL